MRNTFSENAPSGGTRSGIIGSRLGDDSDGPGPEIMAASTLEGDDVVNGKGEDLGDIKEIMIDVPSGRVAYAVLSSGGLLGMGDKLYAIPWQALTLDTERKCFILDVDAERLKAAPGFDKDHWPSMADTTWASEVHAYYGQPNYWEPGNI
jgi:sporulation protein YlmC with PRC-barrel domain